MSDESVGESTPSDSSVGGKPEEKIHESLQGIVNEMAAVLAASPPSGRREIWEQFFRLVRRRVEDILPSEASEARVRRQSQSAMEPASEQLTPEALAWAKQLSSEDEIIAGLHEIRETGGQELRDFIRDLERVAGDDE